MKHSICSFTDFYFMIYFRRLCFTTVSRV